MSSALLRTDVPSSFLAAYVPADYGVPAQSQRWPPAAPAPDLWGRPTLYQPPMGIAAPPLGSINAIYLPPAAAQQTPLYHCASLPPHARPVQNADGVIRPSSAAAATFTAGATESGASQLDDAEGAKQRCTKCRAYFTAQENVDGACQYHPGHYFTPDSAGPVMMPASTLLRWSCCKSPSADSPGCRQQRHVVDRTTAAILRQFGPSARLREGLTSTASGNLTQVSSEAPRGAVDTHHHHHHDAKCSAHSGLSEEEERLQRMALGRMQLAGGVAAPALEGGAPAEGPTGVVMVRHPVSKTDTLAGVSLRYGVKVDDIKQANNLTSQSIFGHKYLFIPNPARQPTPEELATAVPPRDGKKSIALARFRSMTGCATEEAQFYLDEHDLDLARAVAAYQADMQWEQNAPLPRKTTTVTITGRHTRRR